MDFQYNHVRETFSTHLCTIMKLEPFKNTSYMPLHSPVTLRCWLNMSCFDFSVKLGKNYRLLWATFICWGLNSNLFFLLRFWWSWGKCLSLFFLILWNFILLGIHMGTHMFHWSFNEPFHIRTCYILVNGKKPPITSKYFLGLVSICQSGL